MIVAVNGEAKGRTTIWMEVQERSPVSVISS